MAYDKEGNLVTKNFIKLEFLAEYLVGKEENILAGQPVSIINNAPYTWGIRPKLSFSVDRLEPLTEEKRKIVFTG